MSRQHERLDRVSFQVPESSRLMEQSEWAGFEGEIEEPAAARNALYLPWGYRPPAAQCRLHETESVPGFIGGGRGSGFTLLPGAFRRLQFAPPQGGGVKLPAEIFAFSRCMVEDVKRAVDTSVKGIVMEVPASEHIIKYAYQWSLEKAVDLSVEATRYGWWFGVGFVVLIFVHEMGHAYAIRRAGLTAAAGAAAHPPPARCPPRPAPPPDLDAHTRVSGQNACLGNGTNLQALCASA